MITNENGRSVCCTGAKRHSFDISRGGHVNLAGGGYDPKSGDPAEMVRARTAFLDSGWFEPFGSKLAQLVAERGGICVDAGCGDGYYTAMAAKGCKEIYAFDLSKPAAEHGAKRTDAKNSNCFFGIASVYSLPVKDECADTVLCVFAPCAEKEYARILKPGGRLILAAAAKDHLTELKAELYETVNENTERGDLPKDMQFKEKLKVSYKKTLDNNGIAALYGMTPYSRRTSREAAERLLALDELTVTFSFDIYLFEKQEKDI